MEKFSAFRIVYISQANRFDNRVALLSQVALLNQVALTCANESQLKPSNLVG